MNGMCLINVRRGNRRDYVQFSPQNNFGMTRNFVTWVSSKS
jgi:hypothetical protein